LFISPEYIYFMAENFEHNALNLKENKNLVYTAMSKHLFYFRMFVSKFVLEQQKVPLFGAAFF
ncbi:MAG TPA: hypothetical protein VJB06_00530, partial [archaeon]|nr:hypothetical protein [archaeon]